MVGAGLTLANPNDVIADSVPVLGYLDDAMVMIEMCVRDLQHELDALTTMLDFRQRQAERLGLTRPFGRADRRRSAEDLVVRMVAARAERVSASATAAAAGRGDSVANHVRATSSRHGFR